jgi:hypothetical protein
MGRLTSFTDEPFYLADQGQDSDGWPQNYAGWTATNGLFINDATSRGDVFLAAYQPQVRVFAVEVDIRLRGAIG